MDNAEQNNAIGKIEVHVQHMKETVDRLASLMEGKDGVLVRLGKVVGHSKVQWAFISTIIIGLIYEKFF